MWTQRDQRDTATNQEHLGKKKKKNTWGHQELEEASRDPPLESSEGAQPCRHLDFGLLTSRTEKQYISVVLNHPA